MGPFPTSQPSSARSQPGRPIETSITPKPIGNSQPPTPASNSRGSTPNFERLGRLAGSGSNPCRLRARRHMTVLSIYPELRRAFAAIEEKAGAAWMRRHLDHCLEPLLSECWILDIDTTVNPLYGRQEGAVV